MYTHSLISVLWPAVFVWSSPIRAADSPSWHQYVRAPTSAIVRPVTILSNHTRGNVDSADGLVTGSATTVFTRVDGSDEIPTVVVDFGQNVVGQLLLEFAGSTNGSSGAFPGVRLAFSEALEYLTERSDYTRSDRAQGDPPQLITTGTDQIAVKNNPYTWEDQWACEYDDQVCSDGLHAFRYVRISLDALTTDSPYTSAEGQVEISSVSLRWSGYLGTADTFTGWFECSDTNLTQWWYNGVYTVEMGTDIFRTNDTEPRGATSATLLGKLVLHDGAKRDRDPYMGDLAVASLTSYFSHADASDATLNVLEDLAAHQRADGWIPPASINHYTLQLFDYPLYWITCSWDYVFYTGNTSYMKAHYSVLTKILDTYYPAHTDAATQLLVRQDGYGDYAFLPRSGSAAYYSALYVLALNKAAELAELLSTPATQDAARWRERAAAVSQSFQETLWDPSALAYFDRKCTGTGCAAHAQDGNSLAVLSGIANGTTASAALDYLSTHHARFYGNAFYDAGGEELGAGFSTRVYAFISYFEGAARFEAGDVAGAIDLIRRTWGWMAGQDPGTTHWEGIGADGSKYEAADTSLSHGWSTGVTPLLSTYLLGVRPTRPGFREWAVDPVATEDIGWARGVVPTPYGPLGVSWERDAAGAIVVTVDAPEGTMGTVGGSASKEKGARIQGGRMTVVTLPKGL
ncbi:Six-hairpin glycosidase-like protein [Xylaria bambusicola]|uniref:Six-hairpin glycosidase-like protein n=1 Tax=Xylaria bambusicola TaxID=326684 RepID=UPI0020089937|nr:Six-hairpin glycosidase-like protein [Xylaria bambusicola]KAI0526371.1 Six-hairpin glycosidase-like protein [Xylaria bambusicola]